MDVWQENRLKKESCRTKEQLHAFHHNAKQRYHVKAGSCLKKYCNGWTKDGRTYLSSVTLTFHRLLTRPIFVEVVTEAWREYAKKNHRFHYEKNNNAVTGADNVDLEESDDEDCLFEELPEYQFEDLPLPGSPSEEADNNDNDESNEESGLQKKRADKDDDDNIDEGREVRSKRHRGQDLPVRFSKRGAAEL